MMAASKPTSWLSQELSPLTTEHELGTLAGGLGCFPFDHEGYPPQSDSRDSRSGIRSLAEGGRRVAPAIQSVALPP